MARSQLASIMLHQQIDRILGIFKTQRLSLVIASIPPIEAAYLGYRVSMKLDIP